MTTLLSIILFGLSDRIRGSGWFNYGHDLGLLMMGLITAWLLHQTGISAIYVTAMVVLGGSPGWGNPLGAAYDGRPMGTNYEWWQIGVLRESTLAALAVRGFMWGSLLLPVSIPATVAFTVAFVIAPYFARLVKLPWGWMEFSRGALVAILITTIG